MHVLVVGGGITGLTAAHTLGGAGVRTTLVEAAPRLGGKIETERVDGFTIEHGPDSFITTRPAALELMGELGLGDELIGTTEPRVVWILHRGRLVRIPEGLGLVLPTRVWPFVRTPLFSPGEKLRMALDLVRPRTLGPGDEAVGALLRRRMGGALVDRLAGPLVGGIYGTPIDELSLDAVVPQLREAENGHRSLLLAGLAQGRAARGGRPGSASPAGPASESRPADSRAAGPAVAAPPGMFASLRGGMGRLIDALEGSLAAMAGTVTVRCGVAAHRLERQGRGVGATLSDGSRLQVDAVILVTPASATAELLRDELPAAVVPASGIPHGASTAVTLAYRSDQVGAPAPGHGFLVPPADGVSISACTWSSQKWVDRAPPGTLLLRAFFTDPPRARTATAADLVAAARRDVERVLRIAGEPTLERVTRWEGAMPRYTVGHLDRVAALEAALLEWPAVLVAGASYRGVGLPDCIAQGRLAARTAIGRPGDLAPGT